MFNPGCLMDITLTYEFGNINNKMVMDIEGGNINKVIYLGNPIS